MSEQPHLSCETCRYFDVREGNGICRRHPPRVFVFQSERGDHLSVTEWPRVISDEWCGEIEPRYRTPRSVV